MGWRGWRPAGPGRRATAERLGALERRVAEATSIALEAMSDLGAAMARVDLVEAGGVTPPDPRAARAPRTREDLPWLLNALGLTGSGVEVGVQAGHFSALVLTRWQGRKLVSVDPWSAAGEDYEDVANVPQLRHDALHRLTGSRLAAFGDRSEVWRMTSADAAERVADASLDFAYLDARHDERSVREDLERWFPKVRSGGVLAGHDYLDGDLPAGRFGVKTAVDAFFAERRLDVSATVDDAPWISWWVVVAHPERLYT